MTILQHSLTTINDMIKFLVCNRYLDASYVMPLSEIQTVLLKLLKNCLWSNRVDLSLTGGSTNVNYHLLDEVNQWDENIIANDLNKIFPYLVLSNKNDKTVDIILDNSGYEFLSDLCLADFLVVKCGVKQVNFGIKRIPWFVSDVTPFDFWQTISALAYHTNPDYCMVGTRWQKYLESGIWKAYDDIFWCLGLSYTHMPEIDSALYKRLSSSHLIIFKGDLNYRKLIQDCNWEPTVNFCVSRGSFHPAPMLAIRTCKADTVVGLEYGVAKKTEAKSKDWLISGNYAVVQFDIP